jgi:hypothetical protein
MLTTGLHAIGWSTLLLTVTAVTIAAVYLTAVLLIYVVSPGAFT